MGLRDAVPAAAGDGVPQQGPADLADRRAAGQGHSEDDEDADPTASRSLVGKARTVVYEYPGGIADFVRYLNASKEPVHGSVIEFADETDGMSLEVAMQWNASYTESVHTFANVINTAEGGTHEEGFRAALTSVVNRYARDQKLLKEKERQPHRRGRPRGADRDRLDQARRAAVRGPDQDQARQHRGQVVRAEGRPTTTCATGSTATLARPRTSSTRPARRRGRGSPPARRAT